MSDFLINTVFYSLPEEYGENKFTIEYHDGTFIPKYLVYNKFWVSPKYGGTELNLSEYELNSQNIEIVNGKYNGVLSESHESKLISLIEEHKFYINRIVYNNFAQFEHNIYKFKENVLDYYNSICFIINNNLYEKDEYHSNLKEFKDGCDKIFKYLSTYTYADEFDQSILDLINNLKDKIPNLNSIIYDSKCKTSPVLKDAELVLISDLFGSSNVKLENISIDKISVKNIEIYQNSGIKSFEITRSNVENIIFGNKSNSKNYYFNNNTINFINIRCAAHNNTMQFVDNIINIIHDIPWTGKYLFHNNKFSNTAYKKLHDLHKDMESHNVGDWQGMSTLLTSDSKEYQYYYETLNTCWTAGFEGGNDKSDNYNGFNFIIIDAADKFFIANDLNMADLMSKYKLKNSDWDAALNLIKLLAK